MTFEEGGKKGKKKREIRTTHRRFPLFYASTLFISLDTLLRLEKKKKGILKEKKREGKTIT